MEEIKKLIEDDDLTNKAYAVLFENDLLLASDPSFINHLNKAIEYYRTHGFSNSLYKAEREKKLLTGITPDTEPEHPQKGGQLSWLQEGTYIPVMGPVKINVPGLNAHSGIINEARLFALRLKRLAVAIDKCAKTTYTQAIQTQTLAPFAFIGWAWYLPRLTYLIANGLTHTHKKEFYDKNKYKLANDLTWFATGLTTCGITLNWWSKTFSILSIGGASAASTLTASLYLFDVINITLKCNREINRLTQIKNYLEASHKTKQTCDYQIITIDNSKQIPSKRIKQRISLLEQKRRFHVGVATALLVGMTLPLIPVWSVGLAAAGTSIVIGACLTKFYYDRVVQPQTAVSISNEPLKLLLHQLIRHIEKELTRMPEKKNEYKEMRQEYSKCLEEFRGIPQNNNDYNEYELNTIFNGLSTLVKASKLLTGRHKKTTSHEKLHALLTPFQKISWSRCSVSTLFPSAIDIAGSLKKACNGEYTSEEADQDDLLSNTTLSYDHEDNH